MPRPRRAFLIIGWFAVAVITALGAVAVIAWRPMGHRATGLRKARMEASPQWSHGHFVNPQPLVNDFVGGIWSLLTLSADASPRQPVPTARVNPRTFDTLPATGLRVTWFGHSTTLVELDGHRVLTDPVWSERPSPISWLGPKRYFAPLITIDDLPRLDAVIISHDHYDHFDYETIRTLLRTNAKFIVPLGLGADLEYWGVPLTRIVELDWWEHARVGDLQITLTPSRHASGRTLWDKDATLWGSFALIGPSHRVFYSGDTGLFPALDDIGSTLGPFDLAMIEVGQYNKSWSDWHSGPEQAVDASQRVHATAMLPVHWGLFTLAAHAWTEPEERAVAAAQVHGVHILTPRPGESVQPQLRTANTRWWPALPWKTALQDPIVSTQMR